MCQVPNSFAGFAKQLYFQQSNHLVGFEALLTEIQALTAASNEDMLKIRESAIRMASACNLSRETLLSQALWIIRKG